MILDWLNKNRNKLTPYIAFVQAEEKIIFQGYESENK